MRINKKREGRINILITGGFGALGYNLIETLLLNEDVHINIIDDLSSGSTNFSDKVSYTHIDISNIEKVASFFKTYHPNIIFHLAAHFANQNSVDHPISDVQTNIIGLINIFEAQRTNQFLDKIIYTSSSCVYGNIENMTEDTPVSPYDTPYAINKLVGEMYCKYYALIHGMPVVCARIFNSYGPGEMPGKYRNVIPNFIYNALHDLDITITGTGDETRDFTFVMDTIGLLVELANSEFKGAEVFNGGTGRKTSIKFLTEKIIFLTKSNSKILFTGARNWDHVKDRCSDITKSLENLQYNPKVSLDDGLKATIEWLTSKFNLSKG